MQQMTSSTIVRMIGNNDDLFNVTKMNRAEMYEILKNEILNKRIKPMADQVVIDMESGKIKKEDGDFAFNNLKTLYNNIANQWPLIQRKHQEYLLSYGIAFDENDDVDYNNLEDVLKNYYLISLIEKIHLTLNVTSNAQGLLKPMII
jgi:hypothetical protein